MPMLRRNRFWVKLHAVDRQFTVLQPHDRAILKLGGDLKAVRQAFALNHQ